MTGQLSHSNDSCGAEKPSGLAIASLFSGILSILGGAVFFMILPILAIVFGHISRGKCKRNNLKSGMGIALAGLVLGYVSIFTIPVGVVAAIAIPAFYQAREASQETMILNNLRSLSYASYEYFQEHEVEEVELQELVGPGKLIESLSVVDDETYPARIQRNASSLEAYREDHDSVILQM